MRMGLLSYAYAFAARLRRILFLNNKYSFFSRFFKIPGRTDPAGSRKKRIKKRFRHRFFGKA